MDNIEALHALISRAQHGDVAAVRDVMGLDATDAHLAVLDDKPHLIAPPVDCTACGLTPLHVAALLGRGRCVDALLAAGADVRTRTTIDPCSATMMAAYSTQEGTVDIMCTLIRAGADLTERSTSGLSLMAAACAAVDVAKVQVLLGAGAPIVSAIADGNRTLLTTGVRTEGRTIVMDTTSVSNKTNSECCTWCDDNGNVQTSHELADYQLNPLTSLVCTVQ